MKPLRIGLGPERLGRGRDDELVAAFDHGRLDVERGVLDDLPNIELLLAERDLAAPPARGIHDVFHDAVHLADLPLHDRGGACRFDTVGREA